ncbi:MAG: rRNA pseudouridine synthase [Oscillospiraceae bacterium]|nr:rRNA pseudouridine synthase [Oscillospiraceae bacterium]
MLERIQKILSGRGVASRRASEEMIKAGRITCNGQVCSLGQSADPDIDEILVDGKPLPSPSEKVYIMLHKPRGYVTTLSDEKGRPDAASLVSCGQRVYPVGRLDMDSEGLLLFTNDGEFANRVMHPSHEVKKVYEVWVNSFTREGLRVLQEPMELDGYRIRRPDVRILKEQENKATLEITIYEGRNRQVRRMCDHAGMQVTRLKRVAEGRVKLGKLPLGKWRYLTEQEVNDL